MREFRFVVALWAISLSFVFSAPARAILLASYDFENNLNDSSGNGHHGIFMGAASIVSDPVRGNVLSIPSSGGEHGVNIDAIKPIPDFPAETSITLTAWYKRSADLGGNYRYVVNLGENGDNPIATLGVHVNDRVASYSETNLPGANTDQVDVYGQTTIEGGASTWQQWHHLAVVYDRSVDMAHIYLDGVHDGSTPIGLLSDTEAFSWPAAMIGRGPAGESKAPGLIDEVRIFTHALTPYEIADLSGIGYEALRAVVDRTTGEITLESFGSNPATFDFYQFNSESHSLNPGTWNSLSNQAFQSAGAGTHQQWQEMGGSDTHALGEAFLASYSMLDSETTQSIGIAYNNAINGEDLVFKYRTPSGQVVEGEVIYIGESPPKLPGDFNNDGIVDAADYTVWRNNVGAAEWVLNGNGDGSGVVDGEDYTLWKNKFGTASPTALASTPKSVPEPTTLVGIIVVIVGLWRVHLGQQPHIPPHATRDDTC